MKKITAFALIAGAFVISAPAAFAFQPGQSSGAVDKEVRERMSTGESLLAIAQEAQAAGISATVLTSSLILNGANPTAVVTALVQVGMNATAVVAAATASGAPRQTVMSAAISAGADPTALLAATAAGPMANASVPATFTPAASLPAVAPPIATSNFGKTPAATLGGGGGRSVSRS